MRFEIVSEITGKATIARGVGIRQLRWLIKHHGRGKWRKRKGFAEVRLENGDIVFAEIHWYEAHRIGKREMKIKRFMGNSFYG